MSTMSTDVRRQRRRLHGAARYGVTLVTITVVVIAVQFVGHEAGHLFSQVRLGLTH